MYDKRAFTRKRRCIELQGFIPDCGKKVLLVSLCLAFLVTNPVADGSFDNLPSTLERIISPLLRGDLRVFSDNNQTPPALRAPLSRGEAMLCW